MRNKNVDIIRSIALCIVIVYHIWVVTGSVEINNVLLNPFLILGGEIGVTMFFILSGFGIYNALSRMEQIEGISYKTFMRKRMARILPEYMISIVITLLIVNGAVYFSREGIDDIITHLTFTHNYSPQTAGSINGVLWTMAVTVQFYVIAIVLYKLIKKYKLCFALVAIGFTIICKYVFFSLDGEQISDNRSILVKQTNFVFCY